ncbi:PAS domain-containing sensor histidine kinase [Prosthecobacter dejongeii]|uniref:PAS domain S-box-containing protein n=1 Tax=Prosthecobacter dejongeii TaxID=48465 RepID=A0A7W8DPW9_9BACT|nr:PAS domain S-box protein [Prosthecobacter dejongeii]MBB5037610.1 PAS domain S-box-containing protein [Prosthecobacter dejongeii]
MKKRAATKSPRPPKRESLPEIVTDSYEEHFRLLVENIGDVLWFREVDPPRFSYVSPAFERIWGVRLAELREQPQLWEESIYPDDQKAVRAALRRWFTGKTENYEVHYRVQGRDGKVRWLADRGIILSRKNGRPHQIGGIARDITEREAAEAMNRRMAAVVETTDDSIITMNLDGEIDTWNAGAERIFGYTQEEAVGRTMSFLRPPQAEDDEAVFKRMIARGLRIDHYETQRRHKNGAILDVSLTISPIRDAHGRLAGFSKISRDITERKQAEQTILRLNAELERRVEERTAELRGQIAARRQLEEEILRISEREQRRIGQDLHDDLGQQLAGAWMMADVLARTLAANGAREQEAALKLSTLLGKSLNHTRALARGLHPVAPEQGGLGAALKNLAERSADLFGITCQFESRAVIMLEDQRSAIHLYRIAQEAINNAVRHGRAQNVRIRLSRRGGKAALSVIDDGLGIKEPAAMHEGMGLRIMRYRSEMIFGTLEIVKAPKRGTCVTCVFPLPPASKPTSSSNGLKKL